MGKFIRERLPEPIEAYEREGLRLVGKGRWRTTRCEFHGGSDSMRIHAASGGFRCMNCHESGRDVIEYVMKLHHLDFAEAAIRLGCWDDDSEPGQGWSYKPRTIPIRDAMELIVELLRVWLMEAAHVMRTGKVDEADWECMARSFALIERLVEEYES